MAKILALPNEALLFFRWYLEKTQPQSYIKATSVLQAEELKGTALQWKRSFTAIVLAIRHSTRVRTREHPSVGHYSSHLHAKNHNRRWRMSLRHFSMQFSCRLCGQVRICMSHFRLVAACRRDSEESSRVASTTMFRWQRAKTLQIPQCNETGPQNPRCRDKGGIYTTRSLKLSRSRLRDERRCFLAHLQEVDCRQAYPATLRPRKVDCCCGASSSVGCFSLLSHTKDDKGLLHQWI